MFKLPEQFEDPYQREFEFNMSKTILAMSEEVKDRFNQGSSSVPFNIDKSIVSRMRNVSLMTKKRLSTVN